MTLEDSARAALERLTALDQALQSGEDAIDDAGRRAEEVDPALEAEWAGVTRAAEAVLDQIAREADAGQDAAVKLNERLVALAGALTEAEDQAGEALKEIEDGFGEVADRARELRGTAEERLEELRERAQQLEDRAKRVQDDVDDLHAEAAALFDDELRPELADLRADVQERTAELEAFLHEECLTPLGEECDAFTDQLEQYQAELEEAVEGAIERTTQAVREALDACRADFDTELGDLMDACEATARALEESLVALAEGRRDVARYGATTAALHDEHQHGFDGIRETLDKVRETFGKFSFLG